MSTTDSTTTTTWQSERAVRYSSRTEGLIATHWDEITRHLTPPGTAFSWGECGLSDRLKHYLKDKGLIERDPTGRKWVTSMDMWCYVVQKAGDDEVVGVEASGQQLLDAPPKSGSSRTLTDDDSGVSVRRTQSTLTGGVVDPFDYEEDWETIESIRAKDPTRKSDREKAAAKAGQTTLSLVADYDRSRWDVTTPWFRSSAVTVPAGQVY